VRSSALGESRVSDAETQRAVTDVLNELSAALAAESVRLRIDARKGDTGRRLRRTCVF
jgi:hypothetical protein